MSRFQQAFSTVELLVALIIAAALLGSGYQLYTVVLRDSSGAQRRSEASGIAYSLMRESEASTTSPCSTLTSSLSLPSYSTLPSATANLSITCPYGTSSAISMVSVTVGYDESGPQQVTRSITYRNNPANSTIGNGPSTTYSVDATQSVTFNWSPVAGAESYTVSYTKNGSLTTVGDINATSYKVNTSRNDSVSFHVSATNHTGGSPVTTVNVTIPSTVACTLKNGWVPYGNPYGPATFTKTSAGVVVLSGLIKSGSTAADVTVCTLPEGYRPATNQWFSLPTSSDSTKIRLDIHDNGDVRLYGAGSWVSLDGINFQTGDQLSDFTQTRTYNGWLSFKNADARWASPAYMVDSVGRTRIQGMIYNGTTANGTVELTVDPAMKPYKYQHWPAQNACTTTMLYHGFDDVNYSVLAKGDSCTSLGKSINIFTYPYTYSGWNLLSLSNGWTSYEIPESRFPSPRYSNKASDGIVMLTGLARPGNLGVIGTIPGNLGLCPSSRQIYAAIASDAYARIDIEAGTPSGGCNVLFIAGTGPWVSLDGIAWVGTV